jgi:hypothetical protein
VAPIDPVNSGIQQRFDQKMIFGRKLELASGPKQI